MKIRRNEPCPCGSGKKYKNCCQNNKVVDLMEVKMNKEKETFIENFFSYLFENWQEEMINEYVEIKTELPSELEEILADDDFIILSEAFAFHKKVKKGMTPFEDFLERSHRQFRSATLSYLKRYRDMYYSLYQVKEIEPDNLIVLQDIFSKKDFPTLYEDYMKDLEIGDTIFCQLTLITDEKYELFFNMINVTDIENELAEQFLNFAQQKPKMELEEFLRKNAFAIAKLVLAFLNETTDDEQILEKHIFTMIWLNSPNEVFEGLTPLEVYYKPKGKNKLRQVVNEPFSAKLSDEEKYMLNSCKDLILEQLGLANKSLKLSKDYSWPASSYQNIAEIMENVFKRKYTPLQIANGLKIWFDFLQKKQPRIVKPLVWVAVIDNALDNLEFGSIMKISQLAQLYDLSPGTISKNYQELDAILDLDQSAQAYSTSEILRKIDWSKIFHTTSYNPEKAQKLVDKARETRNTKKKVALAEEALMFDPFCVEAYVILGDEIETWEEAYTFYQKGVNAGEENLGQEYFNENKGLFWGLLETRPYMRAKMGLALAMWNTGQKAEGIKYLWEMLELNPNDNQGARHLLSHYLLAQGEEKQLQKLLEKYKDDISIEFLYNKALFLFKKQGDSEEARNQLKLAMEYNKHIVEFLIEQKRLPNNIPQYYTLGSRDEAIVYLTEGLENWSRTPGAISWLRKYYWLA